MTDPISDMLIRIKNAQAVKHERVSIPFSRVKFKIAQILKETNFIDSVEKLAKKTKKSEFDHLDVKLKYDDGRPGIGGIRIISRPSRHMYIKSDEIRLVRSGHGIAVISTPKGIMSSRDARKENVGGEIMFEIW